MYFIENMCTTIDRHTPSRENVLVIGSFNVETNFFFYSIKGIKKYTQTFNGLRAGHSGKGLISQRVPTITGTYNSKI